MATSSFGFNLFPVEWIGKDVMVYVMGTSGLLSAGYTYTFDFTITDANGKQIQAYRQNTPIGGIQQSFGGIPNSLATSLAFPLKVSGTITCQQSTNLQIVTSTQTALGTNSIGLPACYQVSVCAEDSTDKDFNDLVLNFQLSAGFR